MNSVIYFAGGCFWGVEEYFSRIEGVLESVSGYANGNSDKTSYYELAYTNHAEAVRVTYDSNTVELDDLLDYFFAIIDPVSINKQGNDKGSQYRTGIYYVNDNDLLLINDKIKQLQEGYSKPIAIEVDRLMNFVPAEEYHQKYLKKNPTGYCHINFAKLNEVKKRLASKQLRARLSDLEYRVTQENATEPPFNNKYNDEYSKGIYVDIVSGKPLFLSSHKFNAGCGWPSFSRPINDSDIEYKEDNSLLRRRIEVRSDTSHLGHVFDDGPLDLGGKRYCINSAALKFIPYEEMESEGYGDYIKLLDSKS